MSCPTATLLADGKAFSALSAQDQQLAIAELLTIWLGSTPDPAKDFQALSERDQWLCIATLLVEIASGTDTAAATLLAGNPDFQGASEYDGYTAIEQQVCNA